MTDQNFFNLLWRFSPEAFLLISLITSGYNKLFAKSKTNLSFVVTICGMAITIGFILLQYNLPPESLFGGVFISDRFAYYSKLLLSTGALGCVLLDYKTKKLFTQHYLFITAILLSCFFIVSSSNLLMYFISAELISLSLFYLLTLSVNIQLRFKFLIYNSVISAIFLFGISIIFGLFGTLDFVQIKFRLASQNINPVTLLTAILFLLAGFGSKTFLTPFHFSIYKLNKHLPAQFGLLFSLLPIAGFTSLIRFFFTLNTTGTNSLSFSVIPLGEIFSFISAFTILSASLISLWQDNLKKFFSCIIIFQAGNILLSLSSGNQIGLTSASIYLLAYIISCCAFYFTIMILEINIESFSIDNLTGIGFSLPAAGLVITVSLLTLSVFPITLGFISGLLAFSSSVDAGRIWLSAISIFSTIVISYSSLKIISKIYSKPASLIVHENRPVFNYVFGFFLLCIIFAGIFIQHVLDFVYYSVNFL